MQNIAAADGRIEDVPEKTLEEPVETVPLTALQIVLVQGRVATVQQAVLG